MRNERAHVLTSKYLICGKAIKFVNSRISHYPAINTNLIHLNTNVTGSITLSGGTNKNISLFAIC